eukprot:CAMPEP_0172914584 /NCGR_PEP_ID=MMETSP1075-20121228/192685_1 /TAXON_ID=2916 /ORGANISM="Ceratium fusus, Strain PA161109" /LENGTH=509 /DNA_ID=CAMNT_0013773525 /DNA_START=37 /DNA_END=1562 /DNA_ORIENTATION=+
MTCWRNLMGEFDVDGMELVAGQDITYVWMLCYQFLVLLVLLNMLLAIIMDTYALVNSPGSLSIWTQVKEAVKTVQETRGHVDMWYLIVQLEDDDYDRHPDDTVTSKSLRRAFDNKHMSRHNAEYLIRKTNEFVAGKEQQSDLRLSDAVRLISRMNTAVLRNCGHTEQLLKMFTQIQDQPKQERYDAIMAGIDPHEQQPPTAVPHHRLRHAARIPMVPEPPSLSRLSSLRAAHSGSTDGLKDDSAQRPQSQNSVQRPQSRNSATSDFIGLPVQSQSSNGWQDDIQRSSSMMSIPMPPSIPGGTIDQGLDGQVLMQLGLVQLAADKIQQSLLEEFRDIRYYMEQRDSWLEQTLHATDRRLEKVEKANDRVSAGMLGFNFEEMADMMGGLKSALERSDSGRRTSVPLPRGPELSSLAKEDGLQAPSHMHGSITPGNDSPFDDRVLLNFQSDRRHMEQKLDKIVDQVQQVITHQEEAAETRRLIWRIDLSLRQMRTSGAVASPFPQESAEQVA